MTQLFHQLGHFYNWNIESIVDDNAGDGLIIAPRHMSKEKVVALPLSLRQKSIFDPQYFKPGSSRGKLPTYDFFPQVVADEFQTSEWTDDYAHQSAYGCLSFQTDCDFPYLVIPTRFIEGMPSNYIEKQTSSFIAPFLQAYEELGRQKPLLLQVILTDQMLKDKSYSEDILNWITGIKQIAGVYLIYKHDRARKQINDIEFLLSVDFFVKSLKTNGMFVVMGYMNTESIPLMCAEPDIMTFGSYENLRKFDTKSYEEDDDKPHGPGPNARIYMAKLLQWVEHDYKGAIGSIVGNIESFIDENTHSAAMFQKTFKWHFTKPALYKHYFISFSNQFHRLSVLKGPERVKSIKEECQKAIDQYASFDSIAFEPDSSGIHLFKWQTFLNQRDN